MTRTSTSAHFRAALAAAPLLAALACGGGGSTLGGDAAAPSDTAADVGAVPASCELVTQAGCAADQQCSVFCDPQLVIACRAEPASPPPIGAPCMNIPCVRGSTCLATAGKDATCAKLCNTTPDCAQGQACRDVNVTYGCAMVGPTSVRIRACL